MEDYPDFRTFVLKVMDDDNLGVREFARKIGVSHPTISDILAGGNPSLKTCKAIAKYKRMPLASVLAIANILNDPKVDDGSQEVVHILTLLNKPNAEDVLDYAKMKLEKQERETKKNGKRDRVP